MNVILNSENRTGPRLIVAFLMLAFVAVQALYGLELLGAEGALHLAPRLSLPASLWHRIAEFALGPLSRPLPLEATRRYLEACILLGLVAAPGALLHAAQTLKRQQYEYSDLYKVEGFRWQRRELMALLIWRPALMVGVAWLAWTSFRWHMPYRATPEFVLSAARLPVATTATFLLTSFLIPQWLRQVLAQALPRQNFGSTAGR